MEIIIGVAVIAAIIWWVLKLVSGSSNSDKETSAYLERIGNAEPAEYKEPPFRMKRGERYITSAPATLYLHKRDGRVGGHGVTARIKIMKGVYYRAGAGRVGMAKSWQPDQDGELHFTTDRIIFNGVNSNCNTRWVKVIGFAIAAGGHEIHVDRETGADWIFHLNSALPAGEFKLIDNAYGSGE